MALMENMREYTKIMLILLVLAFVGTIIFDWGMDFTGLKYKKGIVGVINGQDIQIDTFWRAYQQELENYQQQAGVEPSEAQKEYLRNQVWDTLVRDILIQQEIQKRKIRVYDAEILHYINNDPPEILKRDSTFMNAQGQFDRAKYQAALSNPQANWKPVEDYLRAMLPFQKFQDEFNTTVFVTESEIRSEYLKRNEKVTAEYLFIDPNRFRNAEIELTDDEIKKYYDAHKDNFQEPEKRKIDYVIYSKRATHQDTVQVEEQANDLLKRAKNGEDFASLAQSYSEDRSADQGGDLNFFKRGAMVKPFEDAAFSAKVGDIVGPVRSQFGLHIIKVTDRKVENGQEMVRASHILLKFEASPTTIEAARDSASYFATVAKEEGWQEALEAQNTPAQMSTFFSEGNGFVPGIGVEHEVSRFVFHNNVGTVSDLIETSQGFAVVRIAEKQNARTKTLDEVKSIVENELKTEKYKERAKEFANQVKSELDSRGVTLEAIAATDSLAFKKPEPFTRNSYIPSVGRDPAFIGTAFGLSENKISNPVEGIQGFYIIKRLAVSPFDENDFASKSELIRKDLLQKKQQQAFASWFTALKQDASIKDYRASFF